MKGFSFQILNSIRYLFLSTQFLREILIYIVRLPRCEYEFTFRSIYCRKIQWFCKDISYLFFRVYSSDSNCIILYTTTEMMIFKLEMFIFRTSFNSFISPLNGRTSLAAWDSAMYSSSVVLNAISIYSLLHYNIGHPAYIITYPIRDIKCSALPAST